MGYLCSKDCPDLCEFDISKDGKIVPYMRKSTQIASVCWKLKGFYKMELLTIDRSYILKGGIKHFQDNDSILKNRMREIHTYGFVRFLSITNLLVEG